MKTLTKNLIYNIFYQILVILLPLITAPYISRTLGATNVGIYSYSYSIAYYFLLFAMLGISNYGNRTIAITRENKKELSKNFWEIYTIQFIMYILSIFLYIFYTIFICKSDTIIAWIQIIYVTSGLLDISWLFFGLEKFKITVVRNTIIKILTVTFIFVFVKKPDDLWIYTLIMSLGTFLSQLYLWLNLKGNVTFVKIQFKNLKKHIKPILVLFIPVIAYSIYKVMDKIMLGNLSTYKQVGFYQSSEKIINIPLGIITAIGTVMMPRMSNIISKGDNKKINEYIKYSIKLVTIVGSAITFGIIGTSDILAPVYFGKEFESCSETLTLLALTIFSISWANVTRTQILIPQKKDKIYIISTIVGAFINLTINFIFIPKYGANGACIGTIFAEFTVMFIQVIVVNKDIPIIKYILENIFYIVLGIVMSIIVKLIGNSLGIGVVTLILQVCVGAIFYVVFAIIFVIVSKDDLLKFFSKKNKNDTLREKCMLDSKITNKLILEENDNFENNNIEVIEDNNKVFTKDDLNELLINMKTYNFKFNNDDYLRDGKYPKILSESSEFMRYVIDKDFNNLSYIDTDIDKDYLIHIMNYTFRKVYYLKKADHEINFDKEKFINSLIIKEDYFNECMKYIDRLN